MLKKATIQHLCACPHVQVYDTVDSTNAVLKRAALDGAPSRSVVIANAQCAGRGRLGRDFQSPPDKGLYLSVLLDMSGRDTTCVTGMAAVAACRAVEEVSGAKASIKWTNDLVLHGRKLCGILAESMVMGSTTALVLGVGVNVHHDADDFTGEVADIATSLRLAGHDCDRSALAAALVREIFRLDDALHGAVDPYVDAYRQRCITLGQDVRLLWSDGQQQAVAEDIDAQFGLVVRLPNGTSSTVRTGEVSVRGLYGYV